MKVGSLFAGIGGFDLGLERAGFEIAWQVEIDPYCQRVLAKHWPDVPRYGDIRAIDWATVPAVDVLCGGFPCQDLSFAGKRAGLDGERSGLWREYVRAIRALRPRYIIVENVPGLLTNEYMGRVLGDLAALGYDAEWHCVPASAVGAPHRRDRVWVVAYAGSAGTWMEEHRSGGQERQSAATRQPAILRQTNGAIGAERINSGCADVADANDKGPSRARAERSKERSHAATKHVSAKAIADPDCAGLEERNRIYDTGRTRTAIDRCDWWAVEPKLGRVAHGIPHRVDRLRGLGNAIVPQIAEWIGQQIMRCV